MDVPEPYHPISCKARNSSVMRGMAVEMMVVSKATQKMAEQRANRVRTSATPVRWDDSASISEVLASGEGSGEEVDRSSLDDGRTSTSDMLCEGE